MSRILTDVAVTITPRRSADGHPFTELHHTWTENGEPQSALSRCNYAIADGPFARAAQIEAFKKRQSK